VSTDARLSGDGCFPLHSAEFDEHHAAKTLSPQELAKLESAFNSDPGSDAYRPLAEAYLAAGRFMEAMVVCKKGVKAHPNRPDPRLLLARVYAEQGKDKKALDELQGALGVAPTDRTVLRALADVQLRSGDAAAGKATLQKVWDLDPKDPETAAAFARWKVEPPKPPPPPDSPPAPVAAATQRGGPPRLGEVPAGTGPSGSPRTRSVNGMPVQRPAAPRITEHEDDDHLPMSAAKKGHATRFIITAAAMVAIIGGWYGWGQWKAARDIKLKKSLKEASEQLRHDSFASYKKATDAATAALDIDPSSALAHGYLAYAYAIRWGEHGDGDDARRFAEEHLASVRRLEDQDSRFADAAEALLANYSGRANQALATLETKVKALDEKGHTSAFLELTQGIIQMQVGDLSEPAKAWKGAAGRAERPARHSALGTLHRRRGDARAADQNYGFALRYERTTPSRSSGARCSRSNRTTRPASRWPARISRSCSTPTRRPRRGSWPSPISRGRSWSATSRSSRGIPPDVARRLAEATGVPLDRAAASALAAKEDEEDSRSTGTTPSSTCSAASGCWWRGGGRRGPRDARGGEGRPEPRPGLRGPRAGADADPEGPPPRRKRSPPPSAPWARAPG
jgi:tetratricopeptide (TPR) repeat protein